MATSTSQLNYHLGNLIHKSFIRETTEQTKNVTKTNKSQLNFNGDEAKIVYEEIINDNKTIERINNVKKSRNSGEITSSMSNINNNRRRNKHNRCNNYSKVDDVRANANRILKAVEQGDIEFLKENLTNENVNIVDNYGWTPLMSAAYCGNESIVEFLLKLGADKTYADKSGFTALQLAEKKNYLKIINLLKIKKLFETKEIRSQDSLKMCEFYCSICKSSFNETTVKKHETSTLHIFNTNPKLPDPVYGISTQNKGYQIMLINGWEESKGLGPSGSGLKYPVKTVLKRDRKGFGHKLKAKARVTHFQSYDANSIRHVKQFIVKNAISNNPPRKRDRERLKTRERRKEIAIRHALS